MNLQSAAVAPRIGACGLKYVHVDYRDVPESRAPHRGVWIEISLFSSSLSCTGGAPRIGACGLKSAELAEQGALSESRPA